MMGLVEYAQPWHAAALIHPGNCRTEDAIIFVKIDLRVHLSTNTIPKIDANSCGQCALRL